MTTGTFRNLTLSSSLAADAGKQLGLLDHTWIGLQAGVYGLLNNGIQLGKWAGVVDEDTEEYDLEKILADGGNYAEAASYARNKFSYDLGGDLAFSLIPGLLAVKAIKAAKTSSTVFNKIGFLERKADRVAAEVREAIRREGDAAQLGALKAKAWALNTGQQVVEGALTTAAIEATLNYGELLNNQGMTATEKIMHAGSTLVLGGTVQGALGGFLASRALTGSINEQMRGIYAEAAERGIKYHSVNTRANNIPTKLEPMQKLRFAVQGLDELSKVIVDEGTALHTLKQRLLNEASTDINMAISELFPKKAIGADRSLAAMREMVTNLVKSADGRQTLLNTTQGIKGFGFSNFDHIDIASKLRTLYDGMDLVRVGAAEMQQLKQFGSKLDDIGIDIRQGFDDATPKLTVLDTLDPSDIHNIRKFAAHATIFKKVSGSALASFMSEAEKFALQRGINADGKLYDILVAFRKYSLEQFSKPEVKYPALHAYMSSLGDDAAMVYDDVVEAFIDTGTGKITNMPVSHIGDLKGFGLDRDNNVVTLGAGSNGVARVVTLKEATALDTITDVLDYQAARLLASITADKLKTHVVDKMSIFEIYQLEALLLRTGDKYNHVKLSNGAIIPKDVALSAIARRKGAEYERLLQANADMDADSLFNTVGFVDRTGRAGLLQASTAGLKAVEPDEILVHASNYTSRKTIKVFVNKPALTPEQATAASQINSEREALMATYREASKKITSAFDDLPERFDIGYHENFSGRRFLTSSTLIGGYNSMVAAMDRIGQRLRVASDEVFVSKIAPAIRDTGTSLAANKAASAEYLAFRELLSRSEDKFVYAGAGVSINAELAENFAEAAAKGVTPEDFIKGLEKGTQYLKLETKEAIEHFENIQRLNVTYIAEKKLIAAGAYGLTDTFNKAHVYLPPTQGRHVTFIMVDADPLTGSSKAVERVVANSKQELDNMVNSIMQRDPRAVRIDADNIQDYAMARDAWEWRHSISAYIKSGLSKGGSANAIPETDIHKVLLDELDWFKRANLAVHRSAVELRYADELSQLNALSRLEEGEIGADLIGKQYRKAGNYRQLMNTMLSSDSHGYSAYSRLNQTFTDMIASAATAVNTAIRAVFTTSDHIKGIEESAAEVGKILEQHGIRNTVAEAVQARLAREGVVTSNDVVQAISMLNHVQAALLLRLDPTDAIMNVIGGFNKTATEIKYLQTLFNRANPAVQAEFTAEAKALFGAGRYTTIDGTELTFSSVAKSYAVHAKEYFSDVGKAKVEEYVKRGLLRTNDALMRDMYEAARISPNTFKDSSATSAWKQGLANALNKLYRIGAKAGDFSSHITQYNSLRIAERLGTKLGMTADELDAFMYQFSRRTAAVWDTPQKPRLFQGSVGTAISLYQSYMFHTIGNLFRYADNKASAANAMMLALNSTFFGAKTLPGFDYINQAILNRNGGKADIYSAVQTVTGADDNRDVSDFLLYGAGGFLLQGNIYSRGMLTPRSPVLVPTAIEDVPMAQALIKAIGSAYETAHRLAAGAPVGASLWEGFVQIGLNRPLGGLADIVRGKSVDSNFNTVMLHEDIWHTASAVRLMGMKPLNEEVMRSAQARTLEFKAHSNEIKKVMGDEIRFMKTYAPEKFNDEAYVKRLAHKYMRAGGDPNQFNEFFLDQIAKGRDDLYTRLESTLNRSSGQLQRIYSAYGG